VTWWDVYNAADAPSRLMNDFEILIRVSHYQCD